MNAARQAFRPKHQVLIQKCYPKFQKNNVEVKANSSELSYLLYYASTRRSKLQKVGDFLDKRTASDVWKLRTGNVQVTLQILKALIEKCPRDLTLYAGAVLRVLRTILKSNDVTMVEESVPTFETLCAHQDPASLAADQDYIKQYEEVVQLFAQFASKEVAKIGKTPISWPVAIRFRKAGLRALKAVASSESLGSETGRQLTVIIPVILNNIYAESGEYLKQLERRENQKEEHEKENLLRRRQSVSTARTDEDEGGDPIAASGTTEDADKLAEEEVGVVALQALRHIFLGVNRGQLRLATSAVLKFIGSHVKPDDHLEGNWSTTLMAMVCIWAPVQDRYAIMVVTVESLVRSQVVEEDLERQLVLATVINHLLSSTINFIGLSVIDLLVGLISHTLLLLQLRTLPLPSQQDAEHSTNGSRSSANLEGQTVEVTGEPSPARIKLLEIVQNSMANLATHVYYTDQISDMVKQILSRLKPSSLSGISNAAEAIEDPVGAANAVASSASLQDKTPSVDRFFSFETARVAALEAVKAIIKTANTRRPDGSSASVSRRSVGVSVWEGTQWLLRDPSGEVRKAYVDALITWLTMEKKKEDLKIVENYRKKEKKETDKGEFARRAVSSASQRDKSPKRGRNTFLPLLHLAVYENALQYVDSESDYLLLHLLLSTLINKLGVNAIRSGLPMVLRLQEDIATIDEPGSKIRIGSLVHGYLWAMSMTFDFETSSVGRTLHAEITRRNTKGLWMKSIRVPPVPLDRIPTPYPEPLQIATEVVKTEALKPFDSLDALVDLIAEGYSTSLTSPPSSPPGSPGRSMSVHIIHPPTVKPAPQLPFKVREDLLATWTKDSCIAANTKDSSSASVTGSRTGTSGHQKNNYLGVSIPNGNLDSATNSPIPSPRRASSRAPSTAYGLVGRLASPHRNRSPSGTPGSTSSLRSTVRVDDLKRVLSGSAPRTSYSIRPPTQRHQDSSRDSSASESMVSVHSLSELSFITTENPNVQHTASLESPPTPAATLTPRPQASSPVSPSSPQSPSNAQAARDTAYSADAVPPVPPIPENLRDKSNSPGHSPTPSPTDRPKTAPSGHTRGNGNGNGSISLRKPRSLRRTTPSVTSRKDGSGSRNRGRSNGHNRRPSDGTTVASTHTKKARRPDFSGFLNSIDAGDDDDTAVVISKAPY